MTPPHTEGQPIRKKDLKWLEIIQRETDGGLSVMYRGSRVDHIPNGPAARLYRRGLVITESPHNPVHKDRWVITEAGRMSLKSRAALGENNG